jgi:1-acyl-sn-glycerol-3-phosphate acyltransferase
MIDQARLDRIRLSPRPLFQRAFGTLFIMPNYHWPLSPTRIEIEGLERLPRDGGVIVVMNHTDRYNYWPFQYRLWREGIGFTSTWVKGKYYENRLLGWFMDAGNNIPLPSKGYLLTKDFQARAGRLPTDDEYALLRQLIEQRISEEEAARHGGAQVAALLTPPGRYLPDFAARFSRLMQRVVALSQEALSLGLYLLIFPQGTRSVRLTRGHTGAAQLILATRAKVVPVGCSGSDRLYPGNSPWSRGGTVRYRVGEPIQPARDLAALLPDRPFVPFTDSAEPYQAQFRQLTDRLMDRINELVDPPYQYGPEEAVAAGARRFV